MVHRRIDLVAALSMLSCFGISQNLRQVISQ
jgi:hypothetical protein